jgi:hypothetical protein
MIVTGIVADEEPRVRQVLNITMRVIQTTVSVDGNPMTIQFDADRLRRAKEDV